MKTYAEFISESLDHNQILLANSSLKKISDLILKANDQKYSSEQISYQIQPSTCAFSVWLTDLIEYRENDDIKKSLVHNKRSQDVLTKLEQIRLNCNANALLYDFIDEAEPLTRLNFTIKTRDLLGDKTQAYLKSGN